MQLDNVSIYYETLKLISGAAQADVAILVVNSTRGEFETGFEAGGQTREHAMLIRSLGKSSAEDSEGTLKLLMFCSCCSFKYFF